jgi:predicted transposase YdaD
MSANHDTVYKDIFGHPAMARDLLAGFTGLTCFRGLEPSAFERVNASYVCDQFIQRHGDMVWKVRIGTELIFVYFLLEFQSQPERWMALRMQVYVGLLYQDLVKRGELAASSRLPLVLPVVFYNGRAPWTAANELRTLVAQGPDELTSFQASQRYLLIDQSRIDPALLANARDLVSIIFRVELSDSLHVLYEVRSALTAWLAGQEQAALRRSIAAWIKRVLQRESESASFDIEQFLEGETMGERYPQRKYDTWTDYEQDQGRKKVLRELLRRQLQRRFGEIPQSFNATIEEAGSPELMLWFERTLEAHDFQEVFAA